MFLSLLFSTAVSAAAIAPAPCDFATKAEVEAALGGVAVDVPASELGEATAPYCLWATAGRHTEMKLSIWSKGELPVVNMADAASYFAKLRADEKNAVELPNVGDSAFATSGAIVVLKGERVFVFEYARLNARAAKAFAARVMARV